MGTRPRAETREELGKHETARATPRANDLVGCTTRLAEGLAPRARAEPAQHDERGAVQRARGPGRVPLSVAQRIRHAEDLRFVRAVLAGEREARERFVDRLACVPGILRAKSRRMALTLDEAELEELVQLALAAIWSKLPRFEGQSALETWAFGFCVNELLKWRERRGGGRWLVPLESLAEEPAAKERGVDGDVEALERALDELGPPATPIIVLKHFEDLTFEEIGARLGISPNTAKTRYYRGFERLRELLRASWERETA